MRHETNETAAEERCVLLIALDGGDYGGWMEDEEDGAEARGAGGGRRAGRACRCKV